MNENNDEKLEQRYLNAVNIHPKVATFSTIPIVTYIAANFKRHSEAVLTVGKVVIYEIADLAEFGNALNYRGALEGIASLDEFIWERYTRDGAQRTKHCMQIKVNAYLYKKSVNYVRLYGDAYRKMINESNFACIDDVRAICDSCAHLQPSITQVVA